MGIFDDALKGAVPGGNIAKPLMIAAGALLLTRMFSHGSSDPQPAAPAPSTADAYAAPDGGLLGGLNGLVNKLNTGGLGDAVNSWISHGPNAEVDPGQLGSALGQTTVSDLARQSGVSEQEILQHLAQALPGLINNLKPNGRLPAHPGEFGAQS